jgi:hypothetical protein
MSGVLEAVVLPLLFLTVTLLGGYDPIASGTWRPPSLFSLVAGVMLVAALVRARAFAPDRLLHASRSAIANANGLVVLLALFAASAQVANMLLPRSGLPLLFVGVVLFLLLLNTLVISPARAPLLRSLAVVIGSTFLLKFVVLAALADPEGSRTKRVLIALFDAATLGTITQAPVVPAAGYVAFFAAVLYLIAIALLPQANSDFMMQRATRAHDLDAEPRIRELKP